MIARFRESYIHLLGQLRQFEASQENLAGLLGIQRELAKRLCYIERRIAEQKRKFGQLRTTIRHAGLPKEANRALKDEQKRVGDSVEDYRRLLFGFRAIGDALVFTLFNKWDLKPLAFRESAGHTLGKIGGRRETAILTGLNSKGFPTVRTDLTNTIRYGDLATSIEGLIHLAEVKSSRNENARTVRQLEAIQRIQDYLITDETECLYGKPGVTRRSELKAAEVSYAGVFNSLIQRSKRQGIAMAEVEPGLRYFVSRKFEERTMEQAFHGLKSPSVFRLSQAAMDCSWISYYPFTLSIREPHDVFEFLVGRFYSMIIIDLHQIDEIAEELGFHAEKLPADSRNAFRFTSRGADPEVGSVEVSRHFFERIGFEFSSLRWIVSEPMLAFAAHLAAN